MNSFVFVNGHISEKRPWVSDWSNITSSTYNPRRGKNRCVIAGKHSNLTIVDIDNKDGTVSAFNQMIKEHPIYTTLVCKTLNGGEHHYFQYEPELITTQNVNGLYIDIRNDGGCAVAPPSKYGIKNVDGENVIVKYGKGEMNGFYEYIDDSIEPIKMPDWLKNWILYGENNKNTDKNKIISIGRMDKSDSSSSNEEIIEYLDEEIQEEINIEKLKNLLEIFPYDLFYIDRNSWLRFVTLIKSARGDWRLCCEYSQRFPDHEPCTCEKVYNSIKNKNLVNNPLTQLQIVIDKYNTNIVKIEKKYGFNFKDDYNIESFRRENFRVINNIPELQRQVIPKLAKVCAYISELDAFVIKGIDDISYHKKLNNVLPVIKIRNGKKIEELNMTKYITTHVNEMNYNKMDYILDGKKNSGVFNKWNGYDANLTDDLDQEAIDAINDVVFNVLADGDEQTYDYILSWFANMLQQPSKNDVALIFISEQGTGKTSVMEIMNMIIGSRNCDISINGIGSITQKHNTAIEGKRLIVVNELCSTREEFRSNFDRIKSFITDPVVRIEPKGFPSYQIKNIGNYVLVSNHEDSVIIERSDRRYQVCRCGEKYMNNHEFWSKWRKLVFNEKARDSYYTFLMNYKCCNIRKIIDTPLRQEIIERGKPSHIRFIEQEKENGRQGDVKASMLYNEYKNWCEDCNEKVATMTKFGIEVKKILTCKRSEKGMVYTFE